MNFNPKNKAVILKSLTAFCFLKYSGIIKARSIFCFITTLFTSVLTVNFVREFRFCYSRFFYGSLERKSDELFHSFYNADRDTHSKTLAVNSAVAVKLGIGQNVCKRVSCTFLNSLDQLTYRITEVA